MGRPNPSIPPRPHNDVDDLNAAVAALYDDLPFDVDPCETWIAAHFDEMRAHLGKYVLVDAKRGIIAVADTPAQLPPTHDHPLPLMEYVSSERYTPP